MCPLMVGAGKDPLATSGFREAHIQNRLHPWRHRNPAAGVIGLP